MPTKRKTRLVPGSEKRVKESNKDTDHILAGFAVVVMFAACFAFMVIVDIAGPGVSL